MISNMFDGSTLPLLEQVVSFTQQRHGVLAGNIANLDTPGYLARDLSPVEFQENLKQAVETRRRANEIRRSPYGAPSAPAAEESRRNSLADVKKDYKAILRHDGNNGGLEEQITEIAKNQQQHNLALTLMNAQFRLLRAAVAERV
jgi:flagellar basal-body rod protein FlgB